MKKIIFLAFFILLNNNIFSQDENQTFFEKMKKLTQTLDSTKFINNILYDRVFPIANLKYFNQEGRKDTSNYNHFSQVVYELNLLKAKNFQINNDILEGINFVYSNQNKCPIGIINLDFTSISNDAFDVNNQKLRLDSINQQKILQEIPNKNPYTNHHTIIISPLVKQLSLQNQPIEFIFDKLFYEMSSNTIKDLNITFDNNTTFNIISNNVLINRNVFYQFQNTGNKILKFTGHFNDNQYFETYAGLFVDIVNTQRNSTDNESQVKEIISNENFTPYISEDAPYTHIINDKIKMKYQIFYAKNSNKLTNPIIIVDGIDFDYNGYHGIYNDHDIDEIYSLLHNANSVSSTLRDLGYDIVIGDFPTYSCGDLVYVSHFNLTTSGYVLDTIHGGAIRKGGTDYIERNAKAFKQLIRTVNDSLVANNSNNQIVVIGPSMGGLVTRYGLAEMEQNGENHNVRLWVSLDAPHQGANIPLAFQYLLYHLNMYGSFFNNLSSDFDMSSMVMNGAGLPGLNSPAAKQMLIKHYLDDHLFAPFISGSTNGAPFFRNRFKNALNTIGYPVNLRKIAIVNGSFMGTTNNNAGSEIGNVHFWMNSFPWGDVVEGDLHYEAESGFKNILYLDYGNLVNYYFDIDGISKYTLIDPSIGSYDSSPGSYINIPSLNIDIENIDVVDGFFDLWISGYINFNGSHFDFIPLKSSLDFKGNNKLLRENLCDSYGNLVSRNLTPFDSYFAPVNNETHIELTPENTSWLLNEIQGNQSSPFPDSNLCQTTFNIVGPSLLCPGEQHTYTTDISIPVTWQVNGLTIISQNSHQITVTKNGHLGLSKIIASASGFHNAYKDIICLPDVDIEHPQNNIIQLISNIPEVPLQEQSIISVEWELLHGNGFFEYTNDRNAEINSTDYYGKIIVTNPKGSTEKIFFGPNPDKCYIIKKTGADKYQVIDRCNGYTPVATMPIKEIYDTFGNKIQDVPVINGQLDTSNSGNSGDIRILHTIINGENVSKTIIKD